MPLNRSVQDAHKQWNYSAHICSMPRCCWLLEFSQTTVVVLDRSINFIEIVIEQLFIWHSSLLRVNLNWLFLQIFICSPFDDVLRVLFYSLEVNIISKVPIAKETFLVIGPACFLHSEKHRKRKQPWWTQTIVTLSLQHSNYSVKCKVSLFTLFTVNHALLCTFETSMMWLYIFRMTM